MCILLTECLYQGRWFADSVKACVSEHLFVCSLLLSHRGGDTVEVLPGLQTPLHGVW